MRSNDRGMRPRRQSRHGLASDALVRTNLSQTRNSLAASVGAVLARTITHALVGLDARRVEVEAHLQNGLPAFAIVGLPDRACQEAKQRVRSGITSAELNWPDRRLTVNLAPAELRKEGSGFDLPIALAVLAASRQVSEESLRGHAAVGELALDGRVRPVAGVLAAAEGAREQGLSRLFCAAASAPEAALAGLEPVPLHPPGGAALEVPGIPSAAGLLPPGRPLVTAPPFRAPHHPASAPAIVGGGSGPRPGEASLAHRGVLFLDELAEFPRPTLEALRQPLEDGAISIARVEGKAVFPARFQLVATMNLCPCGARGDPAAECSCSTQRLAAYRDKLSRALLDRFDLLVTVPRPRALELAAAPSEASELVRKRVVVARERLRERRPPRNEAAEALLSRAVERLPLSARGRARVARVSATVAALAGAEEVGPEHLAEALSFRTPTELAAAA